MDEWVRAAVLPGVLSKIFVERHPNDELSSRGEAAVQRDQGIPEIEHVLEQLGRHHEVEFLAVRKCLDVCANELDDGPGAGAPSLRCISPEVLERDVDCGCLGGMRGKE